MKIIFCHKERTGGMSLNKAFKKLFSYNAIRVEGSSQEFLVEKCQKEFNSGVIFIASHTILPFYDPKITFITLYRHPLVRLHSEYMLVKHNTIKTERQILAKKGFFTYCKTRLEEEKLRNFNNNYINLAGVTERYTDFIELLNKKFNICLPICYENCSRLDNLYQFLLSERVELAKKELTETEYNLLLPALSLDYKIWEEIYTK